MRSVRRVRRVLRKLDPWTVFKFAVVFNAIAGLIFVLGSWVMWSIALQRGIPEGIADIMESLTLTFTPDGQLYFRALVLLTIVWWVVATAAMTLGAVVYNLISDLVGGIEYDVLEESFDQPRRKRFLRDANGRTVRSRRPIPPSGNGPAPRKPEPVVAKPVEEPTAATEVAPTP